MKKKKLSIPTELFHIEQFEFRLPNMPADEYIAYLESCKIQKLTLITEDDNMINQGRTPHTSFAFTIKTRVGNYSHMWAVGTIYEHEKSGIVISGKTGIEDNIESILLASSILVFPLLVLFGKVNSFLDFLLVCFVSICTPALMYLVIYPQIPWIRGKVIRILMQWQP